MMRENLRHPGRILMGELAECVKNSLIVRLKSRIVKDLPMTDDPVAIDDEDRAFGDTLQPNHVLVKNSVIADHLFIEVAEQRECQLLFGVKRPEREERIDT